MGNVNCISKSAHADDESSTQLPKTMCLVNTTPNTVAEEKLPAYSAVASGLDAGISRSAIPIFRLGGGGAHFYTCQH